MEKTYMYLVIENNEVVNVIVATAKVATRLKKQGIELVKTGDKVNSPGKGWKRLNKTSPIENPNKAEPGPRIDEEPAE